ncbi:RNA-directed DNA polymerase [Tanacetum coccineum]
MDEQNNQSPQDLHQILILHLPPVFTIHEHYFLNKFHVLKAYELPLPTHDFLRANAESVKVILCSGARLITADIIQGGEFYKDMIQELAEEYIDHLERGKSGALIHTNHEGSKHEDRIIRPTISDFGGNYASNQSPFNNGRMEEWEEEKKEDRVPTTKIFRSKILINNSYVEVDEALHYCELEGVFFPSEGEIHVDEAIVCDSKTSFRSLLIKVIHAGGLNAHLGRDKTIASVESQFYWPQLKRAVGAFVKRCVVCQAGKGKAQNTGLYMSLPVPESPWVNN